MKLRAEEISLIVAKLLANWTSKGLITLKGQEAKIQDRLIEIFTSNLKVEDDLNAEVETLLEKYARQFDSGELDRRKMFNMVKNQLIKERKLVL